MKQIISYALILSMLLLPVSAYQFQIDGAEFPVNVFVADRQTNPSVATDDAGNSLVVWTSFSQDGSGFGVFARRYDFAGNPLCRDGSPLVSCPDDGDDINGKEPEFRVNTRTAGDQGEFSGPDVAMDDNGDFVVVWVSRNPAQDGSGAGIFGKRFDKNGNELVPPPGMQGAGVGNEFQVNTFTTGDQSQPVVAMDALGNFIVAWISAGQDGSQGGILAQRYDAAGNKACRNGAPLSNCPDDGNNANGKEPEFRVNTFTAGNQVDHSIDMSASGNFVIAWNSLNQLPGGMTEVFAKRYDHAGNELAPSVGTQGAGQGNEFQVNTFTSLRQDRSSVGIDSLGNFVIAYRSQGQDGSGSGVFARSYTNAGVPTSLEFQVNTFTALEQLFPSAAMGANGNFIIRWHSQNQDGSGFGVFAKTYNAAGNEVPFRFSQGAGLGNEFQVNTFTINDQVSTTTSVDMAANGDAMIAWISNGQDGGSGPSLLQRLGVFSQRYAACAPITGNSCIDDTLCVIRNCFQDEFNLFNHGLYVAAVANAAKDICFLTGNQIGDVVNIAAQSNVNKPGQCIRS